MTVACAGHLPPLVLSEGDGATVLSRVSVDPGPPLGIGQRWEERSTHLPSGATVLLYTDGLVETRSWDIDESIERLESLLRRLPSGARPGQVLDTALRLLPVGSRGDDVAALAAMLPTGTGAPTERAHRSLPAQPMSVPLARSWAEGWLDGHQVPTDRRDVVLLALSELVTNAVRQADAPVHVTLELVDDGVHVEVFDSGHRMPVVSTYAPDATGGRGLQLVETVSDAWGVWEELGGKTVWVRVGG